jgi:hypothetical protein
MVQHHPLFVLKRALEVSSHNLQAFTFIA